MFRALIVYFAASHERRCYLRQIRKRYGKHSRAYHRAVLRSYTY